MHYSYSIGRNRYFMQESQFSLPPLGNWGGGGGFGIFDTLKSNLSIHMVILFFIIPICFQLIYIL